MIVSVSSQSLDLKYRSYIDESGILNLYLENLRNGEIRNVRLDVTSDRYRIKIASTLENYSRDWLKDISPTETKLYVQALTDYANNYDNPIDFKKEEMQGIYYLISIFNCIDRYYQSISSKTAKIYDSLKISPYDGYITGLSPFKSMEDISLDISDFQKWLDSYEGLRLTEHDIKYIKSKISGLSISTISLKDYYDLVHKPLEDQISNGSTDNARCFILCGGDCGCCGNYSGQCYFANAFCYVHDYLCQSCQPDVFCLDGCQATPC